MRLRERLGKMERKFELRWAESMIVLQFKRRKKKKKKLQTARAPLIRVDNHFAARPGPERKAQCKSYPVISSNQAERGGRTRNLVIKSHTLYRLS